MHGKEEFTRHDILALIEVSKVVFIDSVVFGEIDGGVFVTLDNGTIRAEYNVNDRKAIVAEYKNDSVKHMKDADRSAFKALCDKYNVNVFSI